MNKTGKVDAEKRGAHTFTGLFEPSTESNEPAPISIEMAPVYTLITLYWVSLVGLFCLVSKEIICLYRFLLLGY